MIKQFDLAGKVFAGTLGTLVLASGATQAVGEGLGGQRDVSFEQLDANGDGEVTPAEMRASGAARFEEADTNGDGKLSFDELEAQAQDNYKRFIGLLIARADADKDGMLTLQEMRDAAPGRHKAFNDLDSDGSGG